MRTNLQNPSPQPDRSERQDRETSRRSRPSRRSRGGYERPVWQEVTAITVEEAEASVRIRFPGKPEDHQRQQLKDQQFQWSGSSGFWFNRKTPENIAFARQIEANGFAPQDAAAFAGADI